MVVLVVGAGEEGEGVAVIVEVPAEVIEGETV